MANIPKVKTFELVYLYNLLKNPVIYSAINHKKYGDVFFKNFLGLDHYYLCHPRYAEHVLFSHQDNYRKHPFLINLEPFFGENNLLTTNNLPRWQKDRALTKMSFDVTTYFHNYAEKINSLCDEFIFSLQAKNSNETIGLPVIAIDELIFKILNETILYHVTDNDEFIKLIPDSFKSITEKATTKPDILWLLPLQKKKRYYFNVNLMQTLAKKVLHHRFAKQKSYDDLLGNFLKAYSVSNEKSEHFLDLCNYIKGFLMAGFTPSISAMRWVLAMIALHPEYENNILSELKTVCGDNTAPSYEDLDKLIYLKAFISEVLRFYPPFAFILRETIAADDQMGFLLPANAGVTIIPYIIHRHPEYWENPDVFNPERFLNHAWGQDYQYAYIPFSSGKRACVGKNFALAELSLILIRILQHYHISLKPDFTLKMKFVGSIFSQPNVNSIYLTQRKDGE